MSNANSALAAATNAVSNAASLNMTQTMQTSRGLAETRFNDVLETTFAAAGEADTGIPVGDMSEDQLLHQCRALMGQVIVVGITWGTSGLPSHYACILQSNDNGDAVMHMTRRIIGIPDTEDFSDAQSVDVMLAPTIERGDMIGKLVTIQSCVAWLLARYKKLKKFAETLMKRPAASGAAAAASSSSSASAAPTANEVAYRALIAEMERDVADLRRQLAASDVALKAAQHASNNAAAAAAPASSPPAANGAIVAALENEVRDLRARAGADAQAFNKKLDDAAAEAHQLRAALRRAQDDVNQAVNELRSRDAEIGKLRNDLHGAVSFANNNSASAAAASSSSRRQTYAADSVAAVPAQDMNSFREFRTNFVSDVYSYMLLTYLKQRFEPVRNAGRTSDTVGYRVLLWEIFESWFKAAREHAASISPDDWPDSALVACGTRVLRMMRAATAEDCSPAILIAKRTELASDSDDEDDELLFEKAFQASARARPAGRGAGGKRGKRGGGSSGNGGAGQESQKKH